MLLTLLLVFSLQSALATASNVQNNSTGKQTIYLLTILPYYNPDPSLNPSWNDGDNIHPALELAEDQINNSLALLQNYTLQLVHAEGGCMEPSLTAVSFVREAFSSNRGSDLLTGIIGPACSSSAIGLAPLVNRSNL